MTKIPLVNFCRSILKDSSHQIHFLKLKNMYFSLNYEPQKYSLGDTEFSYHNLPQEYYYGKRVVEISQFTNINEDDFQEIMETAILFSKFESNVKIMPHITKSSKFEYDSEFGSLKGTPYYGKCPDLLINGNWYEFESFKTSNSKRAFKNMLNRGLKQSDRIIIKKPNNLSDHYMRKNIDFRIKNGQNITEIWLKDGSNLRCFYKKHCNELLPSSYCVNHISYTTKSFIIRRSVKIGQIPLLCVLIIIKKSPNLLYYYLFLLNFTHTTPNSSLSIPNSIPLIFNISLNFTALVFKKQLSASSASFA